MPGRGIPAGTRGADGAAVGLRPVAGGAAGAGRAARCSGPAGAVAADGFERPAPPAAAVHAGGVGWRSTGWVSGRLRYAAFLLRRTKAPAKPQAARIAVVLGSGTAAKAAARSALNVTPAPGTGSLG